MGRAKEHHDGGMKKAAKVIYDKYLIQFPNARVEESEFAFKAHRQQMEATYCWYHFCAQRGVAETQEEFEDHKATKLFAAIYHFVCKRSPNKQRRTHLIKLDDCIANLKPRRQTAYTLFRDNHPDKPAAQFGEDGRRSQIEEIQQLKGETADINDN
ncbi:hypothetical protein EW026_g8307 [Hermanssonia centrifuga]|uniref:Uncharacterized protein n=1 Tax=Hermanssonia centrifuga TaxID=98765 RepID=A0A4S4K6C8_9APHY|nr:hypothetical protein EW026_g8307 [Hermanssonia centrifuga]